MVNICKRNSRLNLLVAALTLSILVAGISGIAAADEWPMLHHDLYHTGASTSTAPTTNNTLWNYTTGGGVGSSPAVVGGVVYVGSWDDNVYALNATTGAQIWNYTTHAPVLSSPAVADGVVYVGSFDDNVYALNATTGAQIWNYTTYAEVFSSPAVTDGVVYVGSFDDNVYALNATTGAQIWNYTTLAPVFSSPAVVNGVVYAGSDDGNVYALNATTGVWIWSYLTGESVHSSPAVVNGVVYAGSDDGNVYALNATTGVWIWSYLTGESVHSSPAVVNGVVYAGSWDDNVYALNATTGAQIWNYTTGDSVLSSPAVAAGIVYVGSNDYNVYALNATTGTTIWNYTTGYGVASSPAVANGKVYVGSEDGNVYCFGLLYKVTFAESGVTGFSGTVLVVDGTDSLKVSDLPKAYWFDAGSSHTFVFQSPLSVGLDKRFVWTSTSGGFSSGQWNTFTVTGTGNVTGNYNTQWRVTFNQSGVGPDFLGSYYNPGTIATIDGANYTAKDMPLQLWFNNGSSHNFTFKSPLKVSSSKQYVWNSTSGLSTVQSGTVIASGPGSIAAKYKTQYYLSMLLLSNGMGTTLPGSGWQDAGTKLNISAIATAQYTFQSWWGMGTGSYTGTKNPGSITMNSTITEIPLFAKKSTR